MDRQTKHTIAEVVSWTFFPPLVATIFFIFLIFRYSSDFGQGLNWLISISPFLIFFPIVLFALSYKLGWINDLDMTDRKERPFFLIVFVASLAIVSAILYFIDVPPKFFVYVFSGLVMTVICTAITFFWKISFHTAVITSVVTAISILGGLRFLPFFILVPLISWARIVLKKHTIWQTIMGFIVAFIVTEMVFYLYGFKPFF